MQINPSQPFTIDFFITDHTDAATYYCRGVIYDATTGELLATHNLTQASTNSRLFSKRVQAPGDPSGQGRRILVIATAYTDSAYTTKSGNYQEQSEKYLVKQESMPGGGGAAGVDYRIIKEIVEAVVSTIPPPEPIEIPPVEFPPMPFSQVLSCLERVESEIGRIPKEHKVNLDSIIASLQAIFREVVLLGKKETDLSPLAEKMESVLEALGSESEKITARIDRKADEIKKEIPESVKENTQKALAETNFTFAPMQMKMNAELPAPKPLPDVSHLMRK